MNNLHKDLQQIVKQISIKKQEPKWMLNLRLKALDFAWQQGLPAWGPDLSSIDFNKFKYYIDPQIKQTSSWEDIPADVKKTFEQLGLPDQEVRFLAGLATQYESEIIYHRLKERWQSLGIIFEDISEGLRKYEKIFKTYFGKLVPYTDNKFAGINTAFWSGGSFIYVPKGVKLPIPVQTYFRINSEGLGQFERTLIIADEGSEIHYIEGCTAPQFSKTGLHAAVVEVFVLKGAHVKYSTLQNWSSNIYNLVTKRSIVEENGSMQWLDCNLGSKVTMKYPATILKGDNSYGELLSLAFAKKNQNIDSGGKMIHIGKNTRSLIRSKSISKDNGVASYRGLVKVTKPAESAHSKVICDGLLLNSGCQSNAYPYDEMFNTTATIEHEASISKIEQSKVEYLMSRGFNQEEAEKVIVSGFVDSVVRSLPDEYTVEIDKLLDIFLAHEE